MSDATLVRVRFAVRTLLVLLAVVWLFFAALSGAEQGGQTDRGVLRNLPNILPWVCLLFAVYIAFRWELIGGIIVLLAGLFSFVFFAAWAAIVVLLGVCVPLIILGLALIMLHIFDNRES